MFWKNDVSKLEQEIDEKACLVLKAEVKKEHFVDSEKFLLRPIWFLYQRVRKLAKQPEKKGKQQIRKEVFEIQDGLRILEVRYKNQTQRIEKQIAGLEEVIKIEREHTLRENSARAKISQISAKINNLQKQKLKLSTINQKNKIVEIVDQQDKSYMKTEENITDTKKFMDGGSYK
eukprot:snap_masked-scaffold_2-processed-gene-18.23-mRNA-1 protein AED:1.00 eAED:1.00 QI:0/0/0/0/1/1/5/0/174